MTGAAWRRTVLVAACAVAAAIGCRIEPGKRFTWSSTIETEYDIGDGEDRQIGYWHFDDAFEMTPGRLNLKLNYKVDKAGAALVPDQLDLRLRVYDSSFKTMKFEYDLGTTGKMKQAGCCNYKIGFKGADDFPGWTVGAGDNLTYSLQPKGGALPLGTKLGVEYVYVANKF